MDEAATGTPHVMSMVVWDLPSPIVAGERFTISVGVKCHAACPLAGEAVEVYDERGTLQGAARTGDAPECGTAGLFAARLELAAPAADGAFVWYARCTPADPATHGGASSPLHFRTVPRPDHRVLVQAVAADTGEPIQGADIRLGYYRGSTGGDGQARLAVRAGLYELRFWHAGFAARVESVEVRSDTSLRLEVAPLPPPVEEEHWM